MEIFKAFINGLLGVILFFFIGIAFFMYWHIVFSLFERDRKRVEESAISASVVTAGVYCLTVIGGIIFFGFLDGNFSSPEQTLFAKYVVYSLVFLVPSFIVGLVYSAIVSD